MVAVYLLYQAQNAGAVACRGMKMFYYLAGCLTGRCELIRTTVIYLPKG